MKGYRRSFPPQLWGFCNDQFFFCPSHSAGRISCSPVAQGQHAGGPHDYLDIDSNPVADVWRGVRSRPLSAVALACAGDLGDAISIRKEQVNRVTQFPVITGKQDCRGRPGRQLAGRRER